MKHKWLILSTGFALFSMFFGSGNLVFPLTVGKESGGHYLLASLGIFLTGVVIPFLGVLGMFFYRGDPKQFFSSMGKPATFWFPLIALSLMGPFGVLARCMTVAHGSFNLLFPKTALPYFSLAFCIITFLITLKKNKIVSLLGSFLTPFLLLSLISIAGFGIAFGGLPLSVDEHKWESFQIGFFQGYQTMDLLAAFFFSTFIIQYLESKLSPEESSKGLIQLFLKSSCIGGGLLALVYFFLVFLGSMYSQELANVPPESMLGFVANQALGNFSAPIVCLAVILACFTTGVVLTTLFADFLKQEISQNRLPYSVSLAITLLIAFSVSTLEFAGIARFIAPILETLYPALITLTILNICTKYWGLKPRRWPVFLTFLANFI